MIFFKFNNDERYKDIINYILCFLLFRVQNIGSILYVQEALAHYIYNKLLYKMGQDFLDRL